MSTLLDVIREEIAHEGPISVERFMSLALSHPSLGYYMAHEPFGTGGDFTTAPEISQMFGELIGLWAADVWMGMGSPASVKLVEVGPGRGTLMADAWRAAAIVPGFREAMSIHLVETSDRLRTRQNETLAPFGQPITWHNAVEDVPEGPAIFIANEFFDALPVRHYVKMEGGWCERRVGLNAEGELIFGVAREIEPYIAVEAPTGSILEIGAIGQRIMTTLAARIVSQGGALLAVDYGYTQTSLGETLQAVQDHQFVDILSEPGVADLTTHVDFSALARAARSTNAAVHGPVAQGDFLRRLGLHERASMLKAHATSEQTAAVDAAVQRLAGPGPQQGADPTMAELFKVIAVTPRDAAVPVGFTDESVA